MSATTYPSQAHSPTTTDAGERATTAPGHEPPTAAGGICFLRLTSRENAPLADYEMDEIHYFEQPTRRQFRFAGERQSDSSPVLAERSPASKHDRCRFGRNAVVRGLASGSDGGCFVKGVRPGRFGQFGHGAELH